MKILMLGHKGVGKTTFMSCMYAALQREIGGFSVQAKDDSDHRRLVKLAADVLKGRFPAPTDQLREYDLNLIYDGNAVLDFEWVDYRGGALDEAGSEAGMQELLEQLDTADGLIAFFDGPALAAGGRAARQTVGRIMVLLQRAIEDDQRIVPIALVVTKADQVADQDVVIEALEPLWRAISGSRTVYGSLIFTRCGLGFSENMEMPTLFVLHKGMHGMLVRMKASLEATRQKAAGYQSKSGFWDWVDSRLNGFPTYGEMASREYRLANDMVDEHNALVEPTNALSETLTNIPQF
jgi:energy-coupling factor transporter ATP-binding protein EcfA2